MASEIFPWFGWVMTEQPKTVGELREAIKKVPSRYSIATYIEGHPHMERCDCYDLKITDDTLVFKTHGFGESTAAYLEALLTNIRKEGYNLGVTKEEVYTRWGEGVAYHIKALNLTFVTAMAGLCELRVGEEKIPYNGDYGPEDELLENDDKEYWKKKNRWRFKNDENPEEKLEAAYQQEEAYPWNKKENKEKFNPAKI